MNLSNTQCPFCKVSSLTSNVDVRDDNQIYENALICSNCHQTYDVIMGVPYLGSFEEEVMVSLLEIAASAEGYRNRDSTQGKAYHFWIDLVEDYTNSTNKEEVLTQYGIDNKPVWLENRYSEHILFKVLSEKIDLQGKELLDIGAGSGYDSLKFQKAGADVTCLEFSPVLCASGKAALPQMRWFGGSADNLPFADSQFDIVVANAALHHLADIPQSIQEALRVLKPGGYFLTLADSFMGDSTTEEQEAAIFNHHTAVLMGINEQVPKFSQFTQVLQKYSDILDIQVFTQSVYGLLEYPSIWDFETVLQSFSELSGDIQFLIRKKQHTRFPQKQGSTGVIQPAIYTQYLEDSSHGISCLVDLVPDKFLNLDLLDKSHPKFRLLNGWNLQEDKVTRRSAYKRARLFFSSNKLANHLIHISLLIPYLTNFDIPKIEIRINTITVFSKPLLRGIWHNLDIEIDQSFNLGTNFFLEIYLNTEIPAEAANKFFVREISFPLSVSSSEKPLELEEFGVETLALSEWQGLESLTLLLSPDFRHGLDTINRLRKFGYQLKLIVMEGQQPFYSWLPECSIVETYANFKLSGSTIEPIERFDTIDLIVSSDKESTVFLQKTLQNNQLPYLAEPGGFTRSLDPIQTLAEETAIEQTTFSSIEDSNISRVTEGSSLAVETPNLHSQADLLKQLKDKNQKLRKKINHLKYQLNDANSEIAAMRTSKFWQMRTAWIKVKEKFNL